MMCNTSFPTFHKVQDELVLEEITLGPDTPVAPHRFSTPTIPQLLPHLLSLIQLEMAARVKDRAMVAAGAGPAETRAVATTLLAEATKAMTVRPVLPDLLALLLQLLD
jgi:hypothetical protein